MMWVALAGRTVAAMLAERSGTMATVMNRLAALILTVIAR
jgi:hypothetical protein